MFEIICILVSSPLDPSPYAEEGGRECDDEGEKSNDRFW